MYADDSRIWRSTASSVTGVSACSGSDGRMCIGAFLRQKTLVFVALLFVVFFTLAATESFGPEVPTHSILPGFQEDESQARQDKIQTGLAELPLSFIANAGQADANVRFMVKAGKHTVFFTPQEVVFATSQHTEGEYTCSSVVRISFAGANGGVKVEGEEPLPGVANFFEEIRQPFGVCIELGLFNKGVD